ncbi:ETX/MTX2 family pore-forming toxin [Bacillus cereus]|uniref:ETX/MTX2 family pore-forming toxin n=1 Tax=Bacillus cereus TaxID=1396 RepID=UPI00099589DB|nr:ETX/MTX2 family pore-forming toxin [Bacillus cereus]OPA11692.1 hypothetical protein BHL54_19670 [Bacillus cereus]
MVIRQNISSAFHDWSPKYTNSNNNISITQVNMDSYKDDNIELGSYKNETQVTQKFVTPSTTKEVTNTFSYTDSNSEKLGVNTETKLGVEIPFVAEGGETIKTTTEFTFTQTSSNTETNRQSVTYPSQTLDCLPGYITSLVVKSSQASFSGLMDIDGEIANLDQLNLKDIGFSILSTQDLYKIYKETSNKVSLPAGVTMNTQNQTVTFELNLPFNGVSGHLTAAESTQVKIEPLDKNKKTVVMSLQEFKNSKIRDNILKHNQ